MSFSGLWYAAQVVAFHEVKRRLIECIELDNRFWGIEPEVEAEMRISGLGRVDLVQIIKGANVTDVEVLGDGGSSWTFTARTLDEQEVLGTLTAQGSDIVLARLNVLPAAAGSPR